MLLVIETSERTCVAEIHDTSYESISKIFECIDNLNYYIEDKPYELNTEYDIYDGDAIMEELLHGPMSVEDMYQTVSITPIGTMKIMDTTFVYVNGNLE